MDLSYFSAGVPILHGSILYISGGLLVLYGSILYVSASLLVLYGSIIYVSASLLVLHGCIIYMGARLPVLHMMVWWQVGGIHTSTGTVGSMSAARAVPMASTAAPVVPPHHVGMMYRISECMREHG